MAQMKRASATRTKTVKTARPRVRVKTTKTAKIKKIGPKARMRRW